VSGRSQGAQADDGRTEGRTNEVFHGTDSLVGRERRREHAFF
jgi:hypothetical protein